ncbi:hypothetical protein Tco_1238299 [Tanacetum coccineum]
MDMYCDNTGAITIADEPGVQKGAKHFQRKYHFIREVIQEGDIRILKVHTDNNLAGPLTKPMPFATQNNVESCSGALDFTHDGMIPQSYVVHWLREKHWTDPTYEYSLHGSASIVNLASGYVSHP